MYQADKAFKHWVDIGFVMRKAWSVPDAAAVMKAMWAHMFFYISFVRV